MQWLGNNLNTISNLRLSPVQPGILRCSTIHTRQARHTVSQQTPWSELFIIPSRGIGFPQDPFRGLI
jgi:hypothetical protein